MLPRLALPAALLVLFAAPLAAQSPQPLEAGATLPPARVRPLEPTVIRTFYLNYTFSQADQNEILTSIRNILPAQTRIFLVPSQNAITLNATPEAIEQTTQLLRELDRPRKLYRLTYSVSEFDGSNRVGVQHYSMTVISGQRTVLKEGSRIPIITGYNGADLTKANAQVTYIDVGLNFDATLVESGSGMQLRNKVEQSSLGDDKNTPGLVGDPVIRQAQLEGTAVLTVGKPLVLGSLDLPSSTRHLEFEVLMELVK